MSGMLSEIAWSCHPYLGRWLCSLCVPSWCSWLVQFLFVTSYAGQGLGLQFFFVSLLPTRILLVLFRCSHSQNNITAQLKLAHS